MNLPEREVHPTHLRTVAGAVLREVVLHLPNPGPELRPDEDGSF